MWLEILTEMTVPGSRKFAGGAGEISDVMTTSVNTWKNCDLLDARTSGPSGGPLTATPVRLPERDSGRLSGRAPRDGQGRS